MTPDQFVAKWRAANLSERSACQQHFLDLCDLLGQPKPADVDRDGSWYTFEKGVTTVAGGKGFADVWLRGKFGWEYKGKHKDLKAAYQQLLKYREALENPPLLVVCDLDQFEVHTNFTGTAKRVHAFDLAGLADPANLRVLRHVFADPDALRPDTTREAVTEHVAARFAALSDGMTARGVPPDRAAHFLMKLVFCMFAEDVDLLPRGLFTRTVENSRGDPARLTPRLRGLFAAMAAGGAFGADEVPWFNGGLFADDEALDLTRPEIEELLAAAAADWAEVEPTVFGTLFERTLDPAKRSQIGAHYTGRADIEALLRPVLLAPLRREWEGVKERAAALAAEVRAGAAAAAGRRRTDSRSRKALDRLLAGFADRLGRVTVLDPACGSGNFLYVALHLLLDLEKEVLTAAAAHDITQIPLVTPDQMFGLEVNRYARELAQVVVWVGFLQWKIANGYRPRENPVLGAFGNIQLRDAVLDRADPAGPREPDWPDAEFVVGNPPFLGGKKLRAELGDDYTDDLFRVYAGRVRAEADLCVYWFEKARAHIEAGRARRAGLLGTQGVRGGANRATLHRIKETGDIFFAESDRDWLLDGAAIHVSMVGFDGGAEPGRVLDGRPVAAIHADLTAGVDVTRAVRLPAHAGRSFMGDTKGGPFDLDEPAALAILRLPNPHGRPNSDVVVPWVNGLDITRRPRHAWIIDFGTDRAEADASPYEAPFEHVRQHVFPLRQKNKRDTYRDRWWLHVEARSGMRAALAPLGRCIVTTTVSKHRLFAWQTAPTLPDHQLIAFAFDDDYAFGILHSRVHEVWARTQGTQVRERESGFRYTPTTCFETFPFPDPTPEQRRAVAGAAADLDRLRGGWLNPPEWTAEEVLEFPGSVGGPWGRFVIAADGRGIGTVRYPRRVPAPGAAAGLAKRTLTNLYNKPPAWLLAAHARLDAAVAAAYGWPADLPDSDVLARLAVLNGARRAAGT